MQLVIQRMIAKNTLEIATTALPSTVSCHALCYRCTYLRPLVAYRFANYPTTTITDSDKPTSRLLLQLIKTISTRTQVMIKDWWVGCVDEKQILFSVSSVAREIYLPFNATRPRGMRVFARGGGLAWPRCFGASSRCSHPARQKWHVWALHAHFSRWQLRPASLVFAQYNKGREQPQITACRATRSPECLTCGGQPLYHFLNKEIGWQENSVIPLYTSYKLRRTRFRKLT